jgi:hypothetical protein
MYWDTDREVIAKAIDSLAGIPRERLRVVRITDTLNLDRLLISEPLAELTRGRADLEVVGAAKEIEFDGAGNLLPF